MVWRCTTYTPFPNQGRFTTHTSSLTCRVHESDEQQQYLTQTRNQQETVLFPPTSISIWAINNLETVMSATNKPQQATKPSATTHSCNWLSLWSSDTRMVKMVFKDLENWQKVHVTSSSIVLCNETNEEMNSTVVLT